MIINVLLIILAFEIGLGTGQSIDGSTTTAEGDHSPVVDCYINGMWYNPCPSDPEPPPPGPTVTPEEIQPQ